MKELDKEAIEMISELNDFHIAPYREDGETFGTLTWIWVVEVEGSLYVRAYNGVNSIWYKSALSQKSGKIKSNGTEFKVQFQPVSGEINDNITEPISLLLMPAAKYNSHAKACPGN